ncbi:MAG: CHAT domain-containing protein [Chloroflexales bacterium]|nr:CHAT domain-containing protein [Chloroflexales bacterium]
MRESPIAEVDTRLVEHLLTLPTLDQQAAELAAAHLLNGRGLHALLDMAAQLVRGDPGKGRQLAVLCADLAERATAPSAVPRAAYIRAQAHAINAEFETAITLIETAREGYSAMGETLEALRTNAGLMHVLKELGRYQEALAVGQTVFHDLALSVGSADQPALESVSLLTAMVHQNRGACYEQIGLYDESLAAYACAEENYRFLQMPERLGEISNNRGVVLLGLGRSSEALAAFEHAAAIFATTGLTLLHAEALLNSGNAHLLLGQYTCSLAAFEQARCLLAPLDALTDKHILLLDTAAAYLALNLYPEALAAYREVEQLLRNADMPHDRARALWGMGAALHTLAHFQDAEHALTEAAELFAQTGNLPLHASVLLEQAALFTARGARQAALETAQQALALVADNEWPVQLVYAHMRLADVLLPNVDAAEAHLRAAQWLAQTLAIPHLRYRLNQRIGHIRMLQGRDQEAQALLLAAIDEIEQWRGAMAHETLRVSFLHDKTAAYEDLVRLFLSRDDTASIEQAFTIVERAKSRALVEMLISGTRAAPATPANGGLLTQLQSLQADLHAVYDELLGSAILQRHKVHVAELHARAVELEQEIRRLHLQITATATSPDLAMLALPFATLQDQSPATGALLAYYSVGAEIVAFICTRDAIKAVGPFSTLAQIQTLLQRLEIQWGRFRAGKTFVTEHTALLEQSAQQVLSALYAELAAPLMPFLDEMISPAHNGGGSSPQLVIVPHGPLHRVPFHALFDGQNYLIERFEVMYTPSVTLLALCRQRSPRHTGRALVLGVPDPSIPAVAEEVHTVAQQLDGAVVYLDEQATLAALRAEAPHCDIIHLACHGLFRSDNPSFSALKLHDGWLTAADALSLDLSGALVMLSACESGRSQVLGGDEIVGLTRALLGAGATTLMVSLWLAQDDTTAALAVHIYTQLRRGAKPAAALRAAQLAIKAHAPHPYYWAPFILVGKV